MVVIMSFLTINIIKRGFATTPAKEYVIKNVTVIGGGLMGSGIAQVAAQSGHNVTIADMNENVLQKAKEKIETNLFKVARKQYVPVFDQHRFVNDSLERIALCNGIEDSVLNADLVIEAIVENIDAKHRLFTSLDKVAPEKTIFASNTSSLSIAEIASVTNRRDRFGGLHFFSPVPVMKLLEVIRIPETSDATYQALMDWGKIIGKVCITAKDTPGFVVNRLLVPYFAEAFKMYERGDATVEDIDTAMKLGAGYPMGPFELTDFVGHDIRLSVLEGWFKKFKDPMYEPSVSLINMVKEGKLGVKSGEGFYKYKK